MNEILTGKVCPYCGKHTEFVDSSVIYGRDADMINAMLMMFIDRVGSDDMMAYKIYEYLKTYPSKLGLDTDFDWAFEHVFRKEEQK